jgi:hypothetical protein
MAHMHVSRACAREVVVVVVRCGVARPHTHPDGRNATAHVYGVCAHRTGPRGHVRTTAQGREGGGGGPAVAHVPGKRDLLRHGCVAKVKAAQNRKPAAACRSPAPRGHPVGRPPRTPVRFQSSYTRRSVCPLHRICSKVVNY